MWVEITIDAENTRAVIDLEESLSASFIPFNLLHVEKIRIITILDLEKGKEDGKFYIKRQYGEYLSIALDLSLSLRFEGGVEGAFLLTGS